MATETLLYQNPDLRLSSDFVGSGHTAWRSPSNIALIKYWGKFGRQRPRNPSVSLTLEEASTVTRIAYQSRDASYGEDSIDLSFSFEGQPGHPFGKRVERFLDSLLPIFPFLGQLSLRIESQNSFPHSSGIASSASSMSALAIGLCQLEQDLFGTLADPDAFRQKASFLARLGSGSASRSVFPVAALWGAWAKLPGSSDHHATPVAEALHPVYSSFRDTILIVDQGEKAVSSRAGHDLMHDNPFAEPRYQQARDNLAALWPALQTGDLHTFGTIVEAEALSLHALMMTSDPPYLLLKPHTLAILEKIRAFRRQHQVPAYFTLDAGPNVHLLYPSDYQQFVGHFVAKELAGHCQNERWIDDRVGQGPERLNPDE